VLISLCIPCHNRTYDLKQTLPLTIEAARHSLYTETVVLDYASPDDLAEYIHAVRTSLFGRFNDPPLVYRKYTGRDYYHMAHARNLSVLASTGQYITILSADIQPTADFLRWVRSAIERDGYVWMYEERYKGVVVVRRDEFVAAGGYDERFEFYGPEDRELHERLVRRGGKHRMIPAGMLNVLPTPNEAKVANYRLALSKREMHTRMYPILEESRDKRTLVANPGGWGAWA